LGIDYPIFSVGFGESATPELAIGVRRRPRGPVEPWQRYASGVIPPDFEGDPDSARSGTSIGVVNDIEPAGQIVRDLIREAGAAFAKS
jgi:hypothetical protein